MDLRRNEQKEERKLEMGGHKNLCLEYSCTRTRTYRHRGCKSRKMMMLFMTSIESLPDVIVFNILLQLPVEYIYEVVRFVCWKWHSMIRTRHFVYEHLMQSSTRSLGVLIHARMYVPPTNHNQPVGAKAGLEPLTYVSFRQQGCERSIDISPASCTAEDDVWASCNGLLLLVEADRWFRDTLDKRDAVVYYLENPITKQRFILPRFDCRVMYYWNAGLAYVAASMEYKVVVPYDHMEEQHFGIFTVGVDSSWRRVNTDHLSRRVPCTIPLATEGFVHWFGILQNIVVTLNAETETLREFHVPQGYEKRCKLCFSTGTSYLSFLVSWCNKCSLSWEVWEMNSETGEWTRLPDIDMEAHRNLLTERGCCANHVLPIGWLKYNEVMLFNIRRLHNPSKYLSYFAYDAHTQKIHPFELHFTFRKYCAHVNSLVCLDGLGMAS